MWFCFPDAASFCEGCGWAIESRARLLQRWLWSVIDITKILEEGDGVVLWAVHGGIREVCREICGCELSVCIGPYCTRHILSLFSIILLHEEFP